MTLEDLRIFVAVAEATSMGEVARTIGRSQPAVAQHVRRLEEELGASLVHRTPRGASLTEAGRILYERASLALRAVSSAFTDIEEAVGRSDETLAFAASAATTSQLLKDAILEVRRRRPGLNLQMEVGTTVERRLEAVRQRRADLAFVTLSHERRGFAIRPVVEMPLLLLVNRDDPMARRKRLPIKALEGIRYIALGGSSTIDFLHQHLETAGVQLPVADTVDTPATAILHVELGLGQTFVPVVQAPPVVRSGLVRAISVSGLPAVPLGWAALDFDILPSVAQEFLEIMDDKARRWAKANRVRVLSPAKASTGRRGA